MDSGVLPYSRFAFAYDDMMANVNYRRWVTYVTELFRHYDAKPRRILDLACGTGSVAVPLAQMGYEVTGLDRAQEMMDVGEAKAKRANVRVEWVQGDMRSFRFDTLFDAVLCLYDSINYALNLDEFRQVCECVWRALQPDGLFIFDVTTERNIVEHFHLQTYAENEPNYSYVWKNVYSRYDKICRTELTFFLRAEDGRYERHIETHLQKIFEVGEMRRVLETVGFDFLSAFDAWSFTRFHRNSDRINITARKRPTPR
jgi:ubiquinone/menaquinone biosynthesis C-methylase UbiE